MAKIRSLFDKSRPIDRRIERVIQYRSSDQELLKREISEYVATRSIEDSFYTLLSQLEEGLSGDREHEIGIWVSGFYGSGKSSFTKYLGLSLDSTANLQGRPFREWLQERFQSQQVRALVAALAGKHKPTVVLLDLSTDALAGAAMLPVSTVLYYKILEWAGYSREKKIAHLEYMLDRDGKRPQFEALIQESSGGEPWAEIRNDVMAAATYAKQAASRLYPKLWPAPQDFDSLKLDVAVTEAEQVKHMLEIIERKTGSRKVLFVLDEVGQYVAPDDDRITNLQGLAQNLKRLGSGQAWIVATAQQTLTEDDSRAALNTPKLFKLKDRFPISVDLEASDIREICYRRLLSKSAEGCAALEKLYAANGEKLRHMSKLEGARGYNCALDKESFVQLYPFLPQHFDILLNILGRLAKTTGGVGLRSAIKVIQDVLIDSAGARHALADAEVGTLATAVSLYDTLRIDIEKSFHHVVEGVRRTQAAFRNSAIHERVAKGVAVLQILEGFPLTRENLAALLHPEVRAPSEAEAVKKAVDELIREPSVPLAEVDGRLRFMSERVNELERQRRDFHPSQADTRMILVSSLAGLLHPQPTARVFQSKTVGCGLKLQFAGHPVSVFGDREEIQMLLELVPESQLPSMRKQRVEESRLAPAFKSIFMLAVQDSGIEDLVAEIHRSEKIAGSTRGQTLDKELEDYATAQKQRADGLKVDLASRLRKGMLSGVCTFQGRENALGGLNPDLLAAVRTQLASAAEQIFERYGHAAVQADAGLAERFLKTRDLRAIASKDDPLDLTARATDQRPIHTDHPALVDIKDYLDLNGTVDGKKLLEDFARSPYGWSKDTTRYLVAALLVAGEVKLRVNNQDIAVRTEPAVEAIKNVVNFNRVGIGLRQNRPKNEWLLAAAERLLKITGQQVLPLEENVTRAVLQHFPRLQAEVAPLRHRLQNLGLPGAERAERLQRSIQDLLSAEAEVVNRLGIPDCELFEDIQWARRLLEALNNGADATVAAARELLDKIPQFPDTEILSKLKADTQTQRAELEEILSQEAFYEHLPALKGHLAAAEALGAATAASMQEEQRKYIEEQKVRLQSRPGWRLLGEEDEARFLQIIKELTVTVAEGLEGIARIMQHQYLVLSRLGQIEDELSDREKAGVAAAQAEGAKPPVPLRLPRLVRSPEELDELIERLRSLRGKWQEGESFRVELE